MDDFTLLKRFIEKNQKQDDHKLHPSTHLDPTWIGHVQMEALGYSRKDMLFGNKARLMTGTMWHKLCDDAAEGEPVMNNVTLTPWLPKGWAGTADRFMFRPQDKNFRLKDFKSITTKSLSYLDEMKQEHRWQATMYWWGAEKLGIPLDPFVELVYIPIDGDANELVSYLDRPFTEEELYTRIEGVEAYIKQAKETGKVVSHPGLEWMVWYDQRRKRHLIKRVPPYWTKWCPFIDCPCNKLEEHRVGWWIDGKLVLDKQCPVEYDVDTIPKPKEEF